MKQNIKVALLGGNGKAGSYLTYQLLQQGYYVKTLIRTPQKYLIAHTNLKIIKGDIKDSSAAQALIDGCDVVISAIGQISGEPLISSLATINIINAMQKLGVKRYILITGLTLDMPGDDKSEYNRQLTDYMKRTYPVIVADKQKAATILTHSDIDWTIVRVPYIETTDERWQPTINLHDCPGGKISTTDLACFIIEQINSKQYINQAPFIASDR